MAVEPGAAVGPGRHVEPGKAVGSGGRLPVVHTLGIDEEPVRNFVVRRDKPAWRRRWKSSTSKG
jgi:hypothetical protein